VLGVRLRRPWALRLVYTALVASSILYAGAGDFRASLLTLTTALAIASMFELVLNAYEALSLLLLLGASAAGAVAFYLYQDIHSRLHVALCIALPLIVYTMLREEV
jgi:uncharacterized membrane protein YjjP (DUF1212 family)